MGVSVFKVGYESSDGKAKKVKPWRVQVTVKGVRVTLPGFTSKSESEYLGKQAERLMATKMSGQPLSGDLIMWVKSLPMSIVQTLAEKGFIESSIAASQGKSLQNHIDDYAGVLADKKDSPKHVKYVKSVLEGTAKERKWAFWQDVSKSGLLEYLTDLSDISARTYNFKLGCWQSFGRWMCEMGRAESSPLEYIETRPIKKDRRRIRRALNLKDMQELLRTTKAAKKRHHMTGEERAMIYQVAVETGLRLGELRKLKVNAFDLKACTVLVRNSISKNAKTAPLSLQPETVRMLDKYFAGKFPANRAFPRLPEKAVKMLRKDLKDAKIPYEDDNGEVFDFHALRGETATLAVEAGVDPKDLQAHMRHSDIHLTMDVYAKVKDNASERTMKTFPRLIEGPQESTEAQAS